MPRSVPRVLLMLFLLVMLFLLLMLVSTEVGNEVLKIFHKWKYDVVLANTEDIVPDGDGEDNLPVGDGEDNVPDGDGEDGVHGGYGGDIMHYTKWLYKNMGLQ